MIDTNITIKLYSFSELTGTARVKALEDHRKFILETLDPNDYKELSKNSDPYVSANRLYEEDYEYNLINDDPIIKSIECNEYLFFEDGSLAATVLYAGHNPLAGELHFILNGKDYLIGRKI